MATIPIVDTGDKRWGIAAAILLKAGLIAYLLLATLEKADPPPPDPVVMAETEIPEEIILENLIVEGGADAGSPTDDEIAPPTPQMEEVLTNDNSDRTEPTGQSSNTNTNTPTNNNSSTTTQSSDPFGSGGDIGDNGSGDTFGQSSGVGTGGPGTGSGIKRVRLNDPVFDRLQSSERATITFVLTIDGQGNIVSATCNKAKTNTTNQILINRVRSEIQRQVKYNKDPGAPLTKVSITVDIYPK